MAKRPQLVAVDVAMLAEHGLFCVSCGEQVTADTERITVHGHHRHQVEAVNTGSRSGAGAYAFTVGCFHRTTGCRHVGPSVEEASFFAGYRWQVALCGVCGLHLGWAYSPVSGAASDVRFYGLVTRRIVPLGQSYAN